MKGVDEDHCVLSRNEVLKMFDAQIMATYQEKTSFVMPYPASNDKHEMDELAKEWCEGRTSRSILLDFRLVTDVETPFVEWVRRE